MAKKSPGLDIQLPILSDLFISGKFSRLIEFKFSSNLKFIVSGFKSSTYEDKSLNFLLESKAATFSSPFFPKRINFICFLF